MLGIGLGIDPCDFDQLGHKVAIDAFISYSSNDKTAADATCAVLEGAGIRCWIAPRDIRTGAEYGGAIIDAIDHCRVMVLVFSSNANASQQIHREIERAVSKGVPILPVRIEEVTPTKSMEYFLGAIHWLDALSPSLEQHLHKLSDTVKAMLKADAMPGDGSGSDLQKPSVAAAVGAVELPTQRAEQVKPAVAGETPTRRKTAAAEMAIPRDRGRFHDAPDCAGRLALSPWRLCSFERLQVTPSNACHTARSRAGTQFFDRGCGLSGGVANGRNLFATAGPRIQSDRARI